MSVIQRTPEKQEEEARYFPKRQEQEARIYPEGQEGEARHFPDRQVEDARPFPASFTTCTVPFKKRDSSKEWAPYCQVFAAR